MTTALARPVVILQLLRRNCGRSLTRLATVSRRYYLTYCTSGSAISTLCLEDIVGSDQVETTINVSGVPERVVLPAEGKRWLLSLVDL